MQSLHYFYGKVVLITGASSGLGLQLAVQLSHPNIKLVLIDLDEEGLIAAQKAVRSNNGEAHIFKQDVSDLSSMPSLKAGILDCVPKVDIILICAGITSLTNVVDFKPELANRIMATNYGGTVNISSLFLNEMIAANSGHIVGISSMAAIRGLPDGAYYSASKAAITNYLESLQIDLRNHGILVTNFIFGFIDTPMNKDLKKSYRMPMIVSAESAAKCIIHNVTKKKRLVYSTFINRFLSFLITIIIYVSSLIKYPFISK